MLNLRYPEEKPALFELWDCYLRDVLKLQQYIRVRRDDFLFHSLLLCLLNILKNEKKWKLSHVNFEDFSEHIHQEHIFSIRETGFHGWEKLFDLKFSIRKPALSAPSCDHYGRHGEWKKYLVTKILVKVANWRPNGLKEKLT